MNHKELITKLASTTNSTKEEVELLLAATIDAIRKELAEGKSIGIQSFGILDVRKKEERLSVHPATQLRTLIPPKLVVNFKQSAILKDKLKSMRHE